MIRGREGEIHAIHRLSPLARARIALIVDLPTKELATGQLLDQYVSSFVSDIAAAWGSSHAIYLDMNRYGPEQLDRHQRHIVEHLFKCAREKRLQVVPVAGTDRGPGSVGSWPNAAATTAADTASAIGQICLVFIVTDSRWDGETLNTRWRTCWWSPDWLGAASITAGAWWL